MYLGGDGDWFELRRGWVGVFLDFGMSADDSFGKVIGTGLGSEIWQ